MTEDERPKGFLKRYIEKVEAGPQNSAEEIAQFKEEREALRGTSREWAELQADHSIVKDSVQYLEDGTRGHASSTVTPEDGSYAELVQIHGLLKPGDASTVFKRFIDGAWVIVDNLE
jgi:hypothetical protein